ncbi:MAG: putative lipid II flippase FtsW [Candidatus Omnitrophica bacterium]|nr:putative lipid II flippase FtsW [Candidatus Omnitrophota bacterium]
MTDGDSPGWIPDLRARAKSARRTRLALAAVTLALLAYGVVMVYSSSAVISYQTYGWTGHFLLRQLLAILVGLGLALGVMTVEYGQLRRLAKPMLLGCLVLLLVLQIPGVATEAGGARRWLRLGPFGVQPAELAGFAVIFYLADVLSRKAANLETPLRRFGPALAVLCIFLILVVSQPDLGTAVALGAVGFILFYLEGMPLKILIRIFAIGLLLVVLMIVVEPYRMNRIRAFWDPWADPRGTGYQIIQSYIALASGGLLGTGLGQGNQKLFYLPAGHTDFIFSIAGEELGLWGTGILLLLFVSFVILAGRIALKATDPFGRLLAAGLVSWISIRALINVAACVGAMPTKGLPFPFFSYGGSSLMLNLVSVGLLLNVARQWQYEFPPD